MILLCEPGFNRNSCSYLTKISCVSLWHLFWSEGTISISITPKGISSTRHRRLEESLALVCTLVAHGRVIAKPEVTSRRRYTDFPTGSPPVLTLKELPLLMQVGWAGDSWGYLRSVWIGRFQLCHQQTWPGQSAASHHLCQEVWPGRRFQPWKLDLRYFQQFTDASPMACYNGCVWYIRALLKTHLQDVYN